MDLFQPFRIERMEIRNRIVMPPMGTALASEEGYVTEESKAYYEERSKGGVGLVIVETTFIETRGAVGRGALRITDDTFIAGLQELARAIKKHGARAAIQLNHGGRLAHSEMTGVQPVAASAVAAPANEFPRELSIAEIKDMVRCFAEAAKRVQRPVSMV